LANQGGTCLVISLVITGLEENIMIRFSSFNMGFGADLAKLSGALIGGSSEFSFT
jgi:hypothetical protein